MRLSSGLVIAVLGFGCGGGGGSVSIADAPAELASASCGYSFRCCTDAEIATQFMGITSNGQPITTESQCDSAYTGLFTGLALPEWQGSITAGRMRFDGAALQTCIDALDNVDCSGTGGNPDLTSQCSPFLVPLVANGGACSQSYECTGGYCDTSSGSGDGTCADLPGAGEDCSFDCASGLFCGFDDATGTSTCTAKKAGGASCEGGEQCTSGSCEGSDSSSMVCVETCTGR